MIQPVNNYLLIQSLPVVSPHKSLKPDTTSINQRWGKVLDVGPGIPDMFGKLIKSDIKPGYLVYVMAHGKETLQYEGIEETYMASELDVLAYTKEIKEGMELEPLGNFIEIEKDPPVTLTKGGLKKLASQSDPPPTGVVKALGTGWKSLDGTVIPFHVKVGDKIIFRAYNPMIVDLRTVGLDETRTLISHGDILGILKRNS